MKVKFAQQNIASLLVGFLFAVGLALSGMTQPQKVIGFLNPWAWDPALLLVMVGAVGVHLIAYPIVKKRKSPLLDNKWHVPTRKDVTVRLLLGSAIFGVGWGLAGYCPGPALTSLASVLAGDKGSIVFVASMIVGMLLFKFTEPYLKMRE